MIEGLLDLARSRLSWIKAVERLAVSVGDDLHGLTPFDRVRGIVLVTRVRPRAPSRLIAPWTIERIWCSVSGEKKISAQRERIAGSMSSGSRVVAPIRMKSAGAPSRKRRLTYSGTFGALSS